MKDVEPDTAHEGQEKAEPSHESMVGDIPGLETYLTVSSSTAVLLMQVLVVVLAHVLPAPAMDRAHPLEGSSDYPWMWAIIMWTSVVGTGLLGILLTADLPVALLDEHSYKEDESPYKERTWIVQRKPLDSLPIMLPSGALYVFIAEKNFYFALPFLLAAIVFVGWMDNPPLPLSFKRFVSFLGRLTK